MSVNDQFKMARIPISPLTYEDKDLANTKELMIDNYHKDGSEPTFHLYITDYKDPTKVIDITNLIIREALFPDWINGDKIKITIEGLVNPQDLSYIINFIYKRFLMPENKNGFVYERDKDKLFDKLTKSILMKDTDNIIYLPVTTADNVYNQDGQSLTDIINGLSRVGFASESITVNNETSSININLPFIDYVSAGNLIQVYIGGTYIVPARYKVVEEPKTTNATIAFTQSIEKGRTVQIQYIFNKSIAAGDGKAPNAIDGADIINGTITTSKLKEVSDDYQLNNSNYVATTKALTNLYDWMVNAIRTLQGGGSISLDPTTNSISADRVIYTATRDNMTVISYTGLPYNNKQQLFVYRDGVRLFEGIDYTNNLSAKYINLYVPTEKNERFVFEVLSIRG